MIYTFGLLVVSIPVLIGWGSLLVLVRKFLNLPSPAVYDPIEPIFGLALLTSVAVFLNFFVAISFRVALGVYILGWAIFLWRMRHLRAVAKHPFLVIAGALWLGAISTHAILQAWNFDSGLYHLPAIRWLVDYPLPLGLGNVHGRLGFDSTWFPVSAILAQVTAPRTPNYAALASELFLAVYGLAVIYGIGKLFQGDRSLSNLLLVIIGAVGLSPTLTQNLSSPSTDHPVLLLTLLLVYLAVRALEQAQVSRTRYNLFLVALFAFYIVTVKVSMLPLLLLPVVLFLLTQRANRQMLEPKTIALIAATAVLILGAWFVRNFLLTGCIVYPVNLSCAYFISWSVTPGQVENEAAYIASWARQPNASPATVLANWDWFVPWLKRVSGTWEIWLALGLLGLGLALLGINRKVPDPYNVRGMLAIILVLLSATGFWFLSAPDLRFGVSWFWALALLILALGVSKSFTLPAGSLLFKLFAVVLFVSAAYSVAEVGAGYMVRAGWGLDSLVYAIPPSIEGKLETRVTKQGRSFLVPVKEPRCFWADMCTPYFNENLQVESLSNGRLKFSIPH